MATLVLQNSWGLGGQTEGWVGIYFLRGQMGTKRAMVLHPVGAQPHQVPSSLWKVGAKPRPASDELRGFMGSKVLNERVSHLVN